MRNRQNEKLDGEKEQDRDRRQDLWLALSSMVLKAGKKIAL